MKVKVDSNRVDYYEGIGDILVAETGHRSEPRVVKNLVRLRNSLAKYMTDDADQKQASLKTHSYVAQLVRILEVSNKIGTVSITGSISNDLSSLLVNLCSRSGNSECVKLVTDTIIEELANSLKSHHQDTVPGLTQWIGFCWRFSDEVKDEYWDLLHIALIRSLWAAVETNNLPRFADMLLQLQGALSNATWPTNLYHFGHPPLFDSRRAAFENAVFGEILQSELSNLPNVSFLWDRKLTEEWNNKFDTISKNMIAKLPSNLSIYHH